ncbi:hypothetical protein PVK06_012009 [Gossypium arboreum]|uniref:Uncharacterized protein n=1 Tax=Gossypium arboreum TaxID=29729 RepID=A0ABR0QB63_GOSAR|nr:hypothetical protein PVK06_012009 [Gossypium arboreum]
MYLKDMKSMRMSDQCCNQGIGEEQQWIQSQADAGGLTGRSGDAREAWWLARNIASATCTVAANRSRKPVEMLKSSGACTNIINNNTLVGAAAGVVDVGCGDLKPTSLIPNSPLELAGDRANSFLLSGHS